MKPVIRDLKISANTVQLKPELRDSLILGFDFEDGNADLNAAQVNIISLLDSPETDYHFGFPQLNTQDLNLTEGAKGRVIIALSSGEQLFQLEDSTKVKKLFRVSITDDAGNESNTLTTDTVTVVPE